MAECATVSSATLCTEQPREAVGVAVGGGGAGGGVEVGVGGGRGGRVRKYNQ